MSSQIAADILGLVEAEDRTALLRFNRDLLGGLYRHVMLVDGNDDRGIEVAIMTRNGFDIGSIRSNVDKTDSKGIIFSRGCAEYEVRTPKGAVIHVLVNHFKSQSGGGGAKRKRQAKGVRKIVDELVKAGAHVVVVGDLNEGSTVSGSQAPNLARLFKDKSPLIDCYSLPGLMLATVPEHSIPASCGTGSTTSLSRRACGLFTLEDVFLEKGCGAAEKNVQLFGRRTPR